MNINTKAFIVWCVWVLWHKWIHRRWVGIYCRKYQDLLKFKHMQPIGFYVFVAD
jgi:hypothetical protein